MKWTSLNTLTGLQQYFKMKNILLQFLLFGTFMAVCHATISRSTIENAIKLAKTKLSERMKTSNELVVRDDRHFSMSQIPNDLAIAKQARGHLLQMVTENLIKQYGVDVLDEVVVMNVVPLLDSLSNSTSDGLFTTVETPIAKCGGTPQCSDSFHSLYRSIPGKCNNLDNPNHGAAVTPIRRLLNKASYADGMNSIRTRSVTSQPLPGAREISNKIFNEPRPSYDTVANHFHMQFGQYIAHDIIFMPSSVSSTGKSLNCTLCESEQTTENCAPIPVPNDDEYFPTKENGAKSCIRFTRALNGQTVLGQRTQLNQNTHFLDLSVVYGSEECEAQRTRSFINGELALFNAGGHLLPPQDKNDTNCQSNPQFPCFHAGDFRNSLQPGLIPLHIVFIKEHNRIAKKIAKQNPSFDDEKLYQEARRINIAQYQHHVYNEYLPILLGRTMMDKFKLTRTSDRQIDYDRSINPSLSAEFAVAAFRFGHSQARSDFARITNNNRSAALPVNLGSNIFYADSQYDNIKTGTSAMVEGMIQCPGMKVDTHFSFPMRNQMFEIRNQKGSGVDLPAVNIMRGRDVGLFPYNAYRSLVGLRKASTFDDLAAEIPTDTLKTLKQVYASVEDIDLYVGIMSETHMPGAMIGPTGGFIIAEQFAALKYGDRFFYESNAIGSNTLSTAELEAVKETSLAAMVCRNSDGMTNVNMEIFKTKSQRVSCVSLNNINAYTIWLSVVFVIYWCFESI